MTAAYPASARFMRQAAALAALALLAAALAWLPLRLAVLAAGGAAAAILLLRRPWLIWIALGAALPFAAGIKLAGPLSVLDLALAAALGLWLADGARRRTLRIAPAAPASAALLYAAVLLLASLAAYDLGQAAAEVVKWLEFAAVLLVLPVMVRDAGQARWIAAALIAGATAQALLGLYQFIYQVGPEWFIVMGRFMRASGTFAQPNPYAGYLGLVLPVALSLTLHAAADLWRAPRDPRRWLWATCFAAATLLIAAALLASWSRGGWLGAAAGVAAVIVLRSRRAALFSAAALLLLLAALLLGTFSPALLPAPLVARVQEVPAFFGAGDLLHQPVNDDNFAVIERVAHWAAAARMVAAAPLLGVGPGNYAAAYPLYREPRWEEPLGHAHNIYLNVLAESGLIGFAAFVLLWIVAVRFVVQRRRTAAPFGAALAVGVLGALTHLAIHSLVDNLFVQGIYLLIALWLALAAVPSCRSNLV